RLAGCDPRRPRLRSSARRGEALPRAAGRASRRAGGHRVDRPEPRLGDLPPRSLRLSGVPGPMTKRWTTVGRERVADCRVFGVERARARSLDGGEHDFYLIDSCDWVQVVPVTAAGDIVM